MDKAPNRLKILQWNCNSFLSKRGMLQNIAHEYDVIILTETWLDQFKENNLDNNFIFIRKDRIEDRGDGIAIALRKNIKFDIIENVTHIPKVMETLAIEILLPKGRMAIIAIYRPPNNSITDRIWLNFLNSLINYDTLFIGGDFNLHHFAWGSDHYDKRAEKLLEIFEDLILLNDGSATYLDQRTKKLSCIDLSFISPQLHSLTEWKVVRDNMGSDHFPIEVEITIELDTIPHQSHRYLSNKVKEEEWVNFISSLENFDTNNIPQNITPSEKYKLITNIIKENFELRKALCSH